MFHYGGRDDDNAEVRRVGHCTGTIRVVLMIKSTVRASSAVTIRSARLNTPSASANIYVYLY
jgi:hypothetical protein